MGVRRRGVGRFPTTPGQGTGPGHGRDETSVGKRAAPEPGEADTPPLPTYLVEVTPLRAAVLALITIAALTLAGELLEEPAPSASGGGARRAPDLRPWDLVGCYRLRAEGWRPASSADPGDGPVPEGLRPPEEILLLPDTLDAWGRPLDAHRAVELRSGSDASRRTGRTLRWLASADTLWLLWSGADVRAGAALFREGEAFTGRVRATRGRDSADAMARAAAWPINCASRLRETEPPRLRRR